MKVCKQCGVEDSKREPFPKHRRLCRLCFNERCALYASNNRTKRRAYLRQWRINNPKKQRQYDISYSYDVTPEELSYLLQWEKGICPICAVELLKFGTGLKEACIDHDHKTKRFRAVICGRCNRALGLIEDQPSISEKLISYLKEHTCAC